MFHKSLKKYILRLAPFVFSEMLYLKLFANNLFNHSLCLILTMLRQFLLILLQQSSLQVVHNACIRFIFGNLPFIPSLDINTRITHKRLELGFLSIASRRFLLLACLFYSVVSNQVPVYLFSNLKIRDIVQLSSRPVRTMPRLFEYKAPRTESWANSFFITGQSLMNKFGVTIFSADRKKEFKTWLYKILLRLETEEWCREATRLSYNPLTLLSQLPGSTFSIDLSSFSFTNQHLSTIVHFSLPFISSRPLPLRSSL